MSDNTESLEWLLDERLCPDDLAWDHAMEISAAVHKRMQDAGMKSKDLADLLGVTPARVSRILGGEQSMTLKTLARLECALDMDMAGGFRHPEVGSKRTASDCKIMSYVSIVGAACPGWRDLEEVKEG